ncbi:MAG: helix-hairpin-helix domain-containing protein, partial [Peptococcaceae bacterium]|nr:helix-hairpin-helix domain-containing protein [Peptococcaceae bacterium]
MMELDKKRKLAVACILGILLLFGIQQFAPNEPTAVIVSPNANEKPENSFSQPEMPSNEIVIHIAGAVENPGVYTLTEGQRVEDALQKAGIAGNADADALNRAAVLFDGQKIVVPFQAERPADNMETGIEPVRTDDTVSQTSENERININTANITQLMALPGIGEVKAGAIIRYRQEH